jgi:hypothetical protein
MECCEPGAKQNTSVESQNDLFSSKRRHPATGCQRKEIDLIETDIIATARRCQLRENRLIRAASLFAQGALLLQQESFDLLNLRHAVRLRLISDGVQRLVPALQRLGRASTPEVAHEHITPQFVPAGELASREAVL